MGGSDLSPVPYETHETPQASGDHTPRLCDPCTLDTHSGCTGVGCYGCDDPYHDRRPGVSGLGDGLTGGKS